MLGSMSGPMPCPYQGMYTVQCKGSMSKSLSGSVSRLVLGSVSLSIFRGNGSVYNSTYVRVNIMFITRHLQDKCLLYCQSEYQRQSQGQCYVYEDWVGFRVIVKQTEPMTWSLSCPDQTIFQGKFHG